MWRVCHVTGVSINAYADDEQIYHSDNDPVRLEARLKCHFSLLKADHWFGVNGMIPNPDKYQAMVLGNTNHAFGFHVNSIKMPVTDSINLLGVITLIRICSLTAM